MAASDLGPSTTYGYTLNRDLASQQAVYQYVVNPNINIPKFGCRGTAGGLTCSDYGTKRDTAANLPDGRILYHRGWFSSSAPMFSDPRVHLPSQLEYIDPADNDTVRMMLHKDNDLTQLYSRNFLFNNQSIRESASPLYHGELPNTRSEGYQGSYPDMNRNSRQQAINAMNWTYHIPTPGSFGSYGLVPQSGAARMAQYNPFNTFT